MCAFYQRTDWPAEILTSNQNFVCNKYKFTCNNLGGWTRFVACMFPENQDNFTLNSKSVVAIILLGRVAFWQHFNLPLLQDLPKWPPPYLSIPKGVPVWVLYPQIGFYKWPDDSFSIKWPDDFFSNKRPDLLLWTCSASWGDPQCCSVPDLEASAPPQATAGKIIICR